MTEETLTDKECFDKCFTGYKKILDSCDGSLLTGTTADIRGHKLWIEESEYLAQKYNMELREVVARYTERTSKMINTAQNEDFRSRLWEKLEDCVSGPVKVNTDEVLRHYLKRLRDEHTHDSLIDTVVKQFKQQGCKVYEKVKSQLGGEADLLVCHEDSETHQLIEVKIKSGNQNIGCAVGQLLMYHDIDSNAAKYILTPASEKPTEKVIERLLELNIRWMGLNGSKLVYD